MFEKVLKLLGVMLVVFILAGVGFSIRYVYFEFVTYPDNRETYYRSCEQPNDILKGIDFWGISYKTDTIDEAVTIIRNKRGYDLATDLDKLCK